jgi:hypothetical protein
MGLEQPPQKSWAQLPFNLSINRGRGNGNRNRFRPAPPQPPLPRWPKRVPRSATNKSNRTSPVADAETAFGQRLLSHRSHAGRNEFLVPRQTSRTALPPVADAETAFGQRLLSHRSHAGRNEFLVPRQTSRTAHLPHCIS